MYLEMNRRKQKWTGKMEKLPNKTPRPIEGHKPAAAILRGVVDKVYANAWGSKEKRRISWLEFI